MHAPGQCVSVRPGDPVAGQIGFGAAALAYVRLGYWVLPLKFGGKEPNAMLPPGGVHRASNDPEQIRDWWETEPWANIGIPTGRLAVVDLDVKKGNDGPGNFAAFLAEQGYPFPAAPQVYTPSGGTHLWLRWPGEDLCPDRPGILVGTDVKGKGGYVVVPPSRVTGYVSSNDGEHGGELPLPYGWETGCPCSLPNAPDWMSHWLTTAPQLGVVGGTGEPMPDIEKLRKKGIPPGERNVKLYRVACALFRHMGTDPGGSAEVLAVIRDIWEHSDQQDFDWREVMVITESARKYIEPAVEADRMALDAWLGRTPDAPGPGWAGG